MMHETSCKGNSGGCFGVSHYTSREGVAGLEELFGWGHQETQQQEDCWEMGWSEKDLCIKCDKGGKLLVCSDSGCPIAVHEKCMGCPARFDDMGNFYCPYCLCRQAIAKSRQAMENAMSKKKALSTFIDEEMMDSDKWKQKPAKGKGKERSQPSVAANVEKSSFYSNENRLDNDDVSNHFIRLAEYREDEIAPECRSVSPCKGADGSLLDKQNEFLAIRESDSIELKDSDSCQLFVHTPKSAPIVAYGRDDVSCEEETVQQFEVVVVGKRVQEQLPRQVDDEKFQRDVEHHQENCSLSDSPVVEEKTSKRTPDDLETLEENGSTCVEEEHTPVREPETTASSNEGDSMSEIHSEAKERENTSNKLCKDSQSVARRSKCIKLNGEHKAESKSLDFARRSSPTVRENPSKIKKNNASSKLRKFESFPKSPRNPFPSGRRKKLLWTEDEEEMLKEGVQKFSSTANKNLPWRKILEFGHHVFDCTRTPVDLKDKWRNILAKEDLAK